MRAKYDYTVILGVRLEEKEDGGSIKIWKKLGCETLNQMVPNITIYTLITPLSVRPT